MIILDTNVVSETMRPLADAGVTRWLDLHDAESLFITSVTLAELLYGAALLPEGARRFTLAQRIDRIETILFAGRILPFDSAAAHYNARVNASARRTGNPVGIADAQIAAIALAHNCPVATRDTAPFLAAGIEVIDPWAL